MRQNISVTTHLAGIVHIDSATGILTFAEKRLDPVLKQFVKKYLVYEGFIEQAVGALDPVPDQWTSILLDNIST
jgi:hypothetical protein